MTLAQEFAIFIFALTAVFAVAALVSKRREAVKARRSAAIAAAMQRHPAGNRL